MPSLSEDNDATRPSSEQESTETTVNNVNDSIHIAKCFKCGSSPLNVCKHCGNDFCQNHRSKYSDQYCYLCIAPDTIGLEYLPLEEEDIDDEGKTITHHGRRIKLIGEGWPNAMQMIDAFPDTDEGNEGLRIFIAERQRLLKEAIELADYQRITLSYAEFKEGYRRHSKAAKLERRYEQIKQGTVRLNNKSHRVSGVKKQESEDEKLMKALGLTTEQYTALKKALGKA